ncbi:MAG: hypothetical protein Q4A16_01870 [Lautropia sp.]|nr:hypothetical protein [Lautropia sp.]
MTASPAAWRFSRKTPEHPPEGSRVGITDPGSDLVDQHAGGFEQMGGMADTQMLEESVGRHAQCCLHPARARAGRDGCQRRRSDFTLLTIRDQIAPPTLNPTVPDEAAATQGLDIVAGNRGPSPSAMRRRTASALGGQRQHHIGRIGGDPAPDGAETFVSPRFSG